MATRKQSFKITTSNLLENNATPEDYKSGLDIADYFIRAGTPPFPKGVGGIQGGAVSGGVFSPPAVGGEMSGCCRPEGVKGLALSKADHIFNSLTSKYPIILNLVNTLDLINSKTNLPFFIVN